MGKIVSPPAELMKAIAEDTRFSILEFLLNGRKCVCEIYPKIKKSQPTISIHLSKMESLGILESRREGKKVFYSIADRRVYSIFRSLGYRKGAPLEPGRCCRPGKNPGLANESKQAGNRGRAPLPATDMQEEFA